MVEIKWVDDNKAQPISVIAHDTCEEIEAYRLLLGLYLEVIRQYIPDVKKFFSDIHPLLYERIEQSADVQREAQQVVHRVMRDVLGKDSLRMVK